MKVFALASALLFLCTLCHASQEGAMKFSSFTVESEGIGDSGPVSVIGKRGEDGSLLEVSVTFLGKNYLIPTKLLKELPLHFNGFQLSYDHGYEKTGGRTLYLQFSIGWISSGAAPHAQTVIAVSEFGRIVILEDYSVALE